ncbi:hypothetical protein O1R50_01970 [Glycomyces luteolus]|uniref:Uncharacterized protein n=1 Tax=Glycomyces luteolus TaxID=2670330 RepID=A0A9X3P743_9ACTN|nr:hypothetical protein [Glycomyces luteolus]MDA1358367.1 hypothetical protein [Glycomyces luteolus]
MNGPDNPPLSGYPDAETIGLRIEEIEFEGLHIRMTMTRAIRIVQLWEMVDGQPVGWIGNVFRIDSEPPCIYLGHRYEAVLARPERHALARLAAKRWKF